MRRVDDQRQPVVDGLLQRPPDYASGGFIADSEFTGGSVINGSQQQFFVRNSDLDGWTNGVWNQVFVGDTGAPARASRHRGSRRTRLHNAGHQPGHRGGAVPVHGRQRQLRRVRAGGAATTPVGPSWTDGSDAGHVAADQHVLHRQAEHLGAADQPRTRARQEPDPDAGRLQPASSRSRSPGQTQSCSDSASPRSCRRTARRQCRRAQRARA